MHPTIKFLKDHETKTNKANWVSRTTRRKYYISAEDMDVFFQLLRDHPCSENTNLIFLVPRTTLQPFLMDLDFKNTEAVELPLQLCVEFGEIIAQKLQAEFKKDIHFAIVQKDKGYFKNEIYKTGCHYYFYNTQCSKADSVRYRAFAVKHVDRIFEPFDYTNGPDDVVDKHICSRSSGLVMAYFWKGKPNEGSQYKLRFEGKLESEIFHQTYFTEKEGLLRYRNYLMPRLYGFCFQKPEWEPLAKKKATSKKAKATPKLKIVPLPKPTPFNLELFLEVTRPWIPNNQEYVRIVMFLQHLGMDPELCNKKCNNAWGYTDCETKRLMHKYKGFVHRGSIIQLLETYGCKEWTRETIFPGPCYLYHNESQMFNELKVWNILEIEQFFNDVYAVTWGQGETQFIYREKVVKVFGTTQFEKVETIIRSDIPFKGPNSDKRIRVPPPLDTLINIVRTLAETEFPEEDDDTEQEKANRKKRDDIEKARETLKELERTNSTTTQYKILTIHFGSKMPPIEQKLISKLFYDYKMRPGCKLNTYHSYVVIPYLGIDPTPASQVNIFPGFDMNRFSKQGNISNTTIFHWLNVAWCNRDAYKLEWLLCFLASKLQFPAVKIQKWLIAFSNETGTGKTSIRPFLEALFDSDKVIFCDAAKGLSEDENSEFLNKLFCVADDIEKASRKVSDSLKSKISSPTFKYKKLYSDKKTLPCYLNLIATSNARTPTFIGNDNRRTELVVINPELKNNREFWKKFYKELDNPDIMGKWFYFLAHKEITLNVNAEECRFDKAALQKFKKQSMKLVHRFIIEFMREPDCFESPCKNPQFAYKWFSQIKFNKNKDKENQLFISKQRLYDSFLWWRTNSGQKVFVKMSTFCEDLKEIGILKSRITIETVRMTCFTLTPPSISQSIRTFYKLETLKLDWCWNKDNDFKIYEKKEWRFRKGKKWL